MAYIKTYDELKAMLNEISDYKTKRRFFDELEVARERTITERQYGKLYDAAAFIKID